MAKTELAARDPTAEPINDAHRKAEKHGQDMVAHYVRCGELLTIEKETHAHGEWLPWVETNLEFTDRQASKYMKVAAYVAELPNRNRGSDLSLRKLVSLASEADREAKRESKTRQQKPEETCTAEDLHKLVGTGRQFGTTYADPPWAYGNQATRASTGNHYDTVSVEWLCDPANMPIAALAAEEAHLHLWTTNAFLFDARSVLEAWGFEYKSCFVWAKTQLGIGNYWRVSHEFMLLGVRGGLTFADRNLKSWAEFPRGKHSSKPEGVRSMIERASPTPRLELFARTVSEGWCCWGDQVARTLLTQNAREL